MAGRYAVATLLDSYAVSLPSPLLRCGTRRLAERALGRPPWRFVVLMTVRDSVMAPFGASTSAQLRDGQASSRRIDFFPVLSKDEDEIVLGEDDRHPDFRVSLLQEAEPGAARLYLTKILPFHHLVIWSILRRLVRFAR